MPEEYRCSGLEYIFEGKVVSYGLYVIFLVYCIQFSYKKACGGFAFKQAEHTGTVQAVNI
jgi:hypothetical protein